MTIKFNVPGSKRKELVKAVSEWLGEEIRYCGAPTFAYESERFSIDRNGTLTFDNLVDSAVIERLLEHLYDEGFEYELPDAPETGVDEEQRPDGCGLTVSVPVSAFPADAQNNLHSIIAAKRGLICKALGLDSFPVQITEETVSFPWFEGVLSPDECKACTHFIAALCEMAKTQKRINAREKEVDNEKYAFRCFLLRLGFIGSEYKDERKILLRRLTGSSAFKNGSAVESGVIE